MSSNAELLRLLSDQRSTLRSFGVKTIGIFGSVARGSDRRDSDVDVLVELERNSFDDYMELLFFLEDLFGRKVDLVEKGTIKPTIRKRVLQDTVYVPNF